ncbi:MAG: hypothetical protein ACI9CE_001030 [Flavobacterium sp.]|jgi:hypothetical protein
MKASMKAAKLFTASVSALIVSSVFAHGVISTTLYPKEDRRIEFPDTENYFTLTFDPHTHSVFSDGHVWPNVRVAEAIRDGLDAIAITEHLEYQPHLADIPHPDRNRAFEIAAASKGGNDLMIVAGSEITRQDPAGHINAIFIDDANALLKNYVPEDPSDTLAYYTEMSKWPVQEAVDAANAQNAFVFWNHSWWSSAFPNGIPKASKFHKQNAKKKLLHGIEIANGDSYSEEAFQIALDLDLTLIGVSDIHGLIDWDFKPHKGDHRPVTLVLAKEKTQASLKEALFEGRTIVWYKKLLIAHKENMDELLASTLKISKAEYSEKSDVLHLEIENNSDAEFLLKNMSEHSFLYNADILKVAPHGITKLEVKTRKRRDKIALKFEVLNALVAPKRYAKISLNSDTVVVKEGL